MKKRADFGCCRCGNHPVTAGINVAFVNKEYAGMAELVNA